MLIREIEKFLERHDMPPSNFGREAVSDPRFVSDLRQGRVPGAQTIRQVRQFMSERDRLPRPAPRTRMRKLGHRQLETIKLLVQFKRWTHYLPGWVWCDPSTTKTLLESLVKRGLAARTHDGYEPTDEGRRIAAQLSDQ